MRWAELKFRLPSGEMRHRALDQPSIAIGRDPSSDVVLDDPSVAALHALVLTREDGATIVDQDSASGTFVNGTRVEPNDAVRIQAGDHLRLGFVEGTLASSELVGRVDPASVVVASVRLTLLPPDEPIEPGWVGHATLDLENMGGAPAAFELSVEGLPSGWAKPALESVSVAAGGREVVRFSVQPPRDADIAGDVAVVVVARMIDAPHDTARLSAAVRILAVDSLAVALVPERGAGPADVVLQSRSRDPRWYQLSADDLEQALTFAFSPNALAVPGGGEARSRLTVTTRGRPILGLSRTKRYQVTATPQEPGIAPTKVVGEHVVRPRVPPVLLFGAIALVALLLIGNDAVCSTLGLPGCAGTDIRFAAEPVEIRSGGQSVLTWEVTGATRVEILPEPGAVEVSGTWPVSPAQSTEYTLRVEGARGDIEERTVLVQVVGAPQVIATIAATARSTAEVLASGCVVAVPAGSGADLHEGPGVAYRVIGILAAGTRVQPRYRNGAGDWLLVYANNGDGWLAREKMACEPQGTIEGLVDLPTVDPASIAPPPATGTASPTWTAQPSATPQATTTPPATTTPLSTSTPAASATVSGTPTATATPTVRSP